MDDPRTTQALEQLAAMYLTGPTQAPAAAKAEAASDAFCPPPRPRQAADTFSPTERAAELVIVGHLPGLANLWLNQYAQRQADEHGRSVVVVRVDDEPGFELDRFSPMRRHGDDEADDAEHRPVWAATGGAGAHGGANGHPQGVHPAAPAGEPTLAEALAALVSDGPMWIVHARHHAVEVLEPLLPAAAAWTLLSGADEAAIVGGYRLLKQYLAANDDQAPRQLRVMIMGASEPDARAAADRLERTVYRFLDIEELDKARQQKMQPVRRRAWGRFEADRASFDALRRAIATTGPHADQPHPSSQSAQPPALHLAGYADERDAEVAIDAEATPDAEVAAAPLVAAAGNAEAQPQAGTGATAAAATDVPDDASPVAAAAWPDADEPGEAGASDPPATDRTIRPLADYVAELHPLRARCPHHADVELAVDGTGRLHVLASDAAEASDSQTVPAVQALYETRAWTVEHAGLLAMTLVRHKVDPNAVPQLHLFTNAPRRYLHLAAAGALRLHLLHPDHRGPAHGWTCVELT